MAHPWIFIHGANRPIVDTGLKVLLFAFFAIFPLPHFWKRLNSLVLPTLLVVATQLVRLFTRLIGDSQPF